MTELKQCPFCGGEARIAINYLGQHSVVCEGCECRVWFSRDNGITYEGEELLEKWNARKDGDG